MYLRLTFTYGNLNLIFPLFASLDKLNRHTILFCPEKPGPLGQVRVLRLCLGTLYQKIQAPSTKLQINLKFQYPISEIVVFLSDHKFGILNFGHCYLFDI